MVLEDLLIIKLQNLKFNIILAYYKQVILFNKEFKRIF